jgi:hypothetical protein
MPAVDPFARHAPGVADPARDAMTVTLSDSTDLGFVTSALYLPEPGDLSVITLAGQTRLLAGLGAGWHPLRVTRVRASGTTLSQLIVAW